MPCSFFPSVQRRPTAVSSPFVALLVAGLLTLAADQAQAWGLDDVAALARTQAQAPFKPANQAMPAFSCAPPTNRWPPWAWRMPLRVQRLNPAQPVELRAFLQHNQQTLSETWTNLITP